MNRGIFNKVMMILIFLALVANLVMYASGTKETVAQEPRRGRSPEYAIALSIKDVAKALEKVASSNDNIAKSIDRLAQVKSLSNND